MILYIKPSLIALVIGGQTIQADLGNHDLIGVLQACIQIKVLEII